MAFSIRDLISGKRIANPVTATLEEKAGVALDRMIKNDFSQLPVVDGERRPKGLITHASILRMVRHSGAGLGALTVEQSMEEGESRTYELDSDLFHLLNELQRWDAALVVRSDRQLEAIVTSTDAADFLRGRFEDFMLVENIETHLKEVILSVTDNDPKQAIVDAIGDRSELRQKSKAVINRYLKRSGGSFDSTMFTEAFDEAVPRKEPPEFGRLTLNQYIQMILHERHWDSMRQHFTPDKDALKAQLEWVNERRNELAHFRASLTDQDKEHLKAIERLFRRKKRPAAVAQSAPTAEPAMGRVDPTAEVVKPDDSRFDLLGAYLGNQTESSLYLSFREIEEIIRAKLPPSASVHRAWWANDERGHSSSWLRAGWRVTDVRVADRLIGFARIPGREQLYKKFYEDLLARLRKEADFALRRTRPNGDSWIWVADLRRGVAQAHYAFSFAQGRRFRVELYIDNGTKFENKEFFDLLQGCRAQIEAELDRKLSWERLDDKRASRIAAYEDDVAIDDADRLEELSNVALDLMLRFQRTISTAVSTLPPLRKVSSR